MFRNYLHSRFQALHPTQSQEVVDKAWEVIYKSYMESQRYYHTLEHLYNLFQQLDQVKHLVQNIPVISAAIFYHDIVYRPGSADNETASAEIAEKELRDLCWKERDIREVAAYVRSTRDHVADSKVLNPGDLTLFLDLDLSILGMDWETYRMYSHNILKEFGNNAMVKWGRKGFMQKFLLQPHIYHTSYFRNRFESKARDNIKREVEELQK